MSFGLLTISGVSKYPSRLAVSNTVKTTSDRRLQFLESSLHTAIEISNRSVSRCHDTQRVYATSTPQGNIVAVRIGCSGVERPQAEIHRRICAT